MKYKFKAGHNKNTLMKLLGVSTVEALARKTFYSRDGIYKMDRKGYTQKFVDICEWLNADTEDLFEEVE